MHRIHPAVKGLLLTGIFLSAVLSSSAMAQEVRYAWLDMSYLAQDAGISGTQPTSVPGQSVVANATDGDGIRFRGSAGAWHHMYMFIDFASTDIDVAAVVTNPEPVDSVDDEFDFTTIRGGLGVRIPIGLGPATDLYAEVSYDSMDLDFGQFVDEEWDTSNKDVGGALGVRAMLNDDWELRAYGRYTNHGDVDMTSGEFDEDTVFGVGFGWQIVRGFSIVGDYETGEFSNWSIGFRLDLDEN